VIIAAIGGVATCAAAYIGLMSHLLDRDRTDHSFPTHIVAYQPTEAPEWRRTPPPRLLEESQTPRPSPPEERPTTRPRPTEESPFESSDVEPPAVPPKNNQCPFRADASLLNYPGIWYGPFFVRGISYAIGYDLQHIYVADSIGGLNSWDDPAVSNRRNQWLRLNGTPFRVCVDQAGMVLAALEL
jgi:hypothetical protein